MDQIVALIQQYGGQLSAAALLGIFVLLIGRGLLVPKLVLDGWVRVWQERLADKTAEAASWREAYEAERSAKARMEEDISRLLELGETTVRVLQAIPKLPQQRREGPRP